MPVIDDRGRLFGKLNLIDAIVMVVALGLIPLAYGAFMLFREQPPIITSIQPTQVTQGERTTLQLIGEGFRPFLVARLGDFESSGFLVQSPTIAEVRMPELLPGSYDLALFDQAREIMRMPGAITVVPPPAPPVPVEAIQPELPPPPTLVEPPPTLVELRVAGEFIGMSRGDAERIRVGLKLEHANSVTPAVEEPRRFPVTAEVLAVGMLEVDAFRLRAGTPANMNSAAVTAPGMEEVRVPALIRVSCAIKENPAPLLGECNFGDTVLGQNATIPLTGLSTDGTDTSPTQIIFMIREVLPAVPAVSPSPPTLIELRVAGEFIGMSRGDAERIRVGLKLEDANSVTPAVEEPRRSPATAEVLAVGMPDIKPIRLRAGTPENMNNATVTAPGMGEVRVPALIRVSCAIKENPAPLLGDCNFGDTPLGRNQMIALTEPSTDDTGTSLTQIIFMIGEVLPATVSTTSPSGQVDVEVEGEFVGLTRDDLQFVEVGSKFERWKGEPFAEVLAVGTPEPGMQYVRLGGGAFRTTAEGELAVRAIVRINCVITTSEDCLVIDTVLAQNATLLLPVPRRSNRVKFMVGEVRLADAPATSPSSRVDVQVEGEFFGLTQDDLGFVEVGSKFEQWKDEPFAEVLAVGTPEPGTQRVRIEGGAFRTTAEGELAVRAIVRINCVITTSEDCLVDDTVLKQNATVLLPVPGRFARVKFMVDAMRPGDAPAVFSSVITAIATVRVRFIAVQEVLDTMKVGDIDLSGLVTRVDEAGAVLLTIGQERQRKTSLTNTDGLLGRSVQVEESVVSFTGTVRVPVVLTQAGWSYRNQSIKVGAGFNFETISGAMRGVILDMVVSDQEGGVAR